ncbi:MAG: sulfatase [Rikenellaceae bacterium]
MKNLTPIAALPLVVASCAGGVEELPKPNIVWFMIEDTSPQYMALYNDGVGAKTPNLEGLIGESILYTNSFSNAPVSSAARTTLITGCYAPRVAGSLHRKIEPMEMPEGLNMFPAYLRQAGYYTCNAQKTDYNVKTDKSAWDNIKGDVGSWRDREDPSQPFFYVRTTMTSHESKLLFDEATYESVKTRYNPDDVKVHPYLPDTDLVRYTYATFYDRIEDTDTEFGQILSMLEEDGVMDNTFIFFFGDNGGSIPGTKGYTDNIGLRVPLVVYVPEMWREALGIKGGERRDAMVSFMDYGATILNLAGIEVPEKMDGRPFLGVGAAEGRESAVCYGDRFDDLYAFNRVLYRDNFRYARNYQPYHTQGLFSYYRYKSLVFQQWREMYLNGELTPAQASFFEPFGAEELYDQVNDPNELNNLAGDPAYGAMLKKMRGELAAFVDERCDLGFLPEPEILEQSGAKPAEFGAANKSRINRYREVADLQLLSFDEAAPQIEVAINSEDDVERWWGITSAICFGREAVESKPIREAIEAIAKGTDERAYLRTRAEVYLSRGGAKRMSEGEVKSLLSSSKNVAEELLTLNDLAHLFEMNLLPKLRLDKADVPHKDYSVTERLKYLSSK